MKIVLKYIKPYRFMLVFVLVFLLMRCAGELLLPTIMSDIINEGIAAKNTDYIIKKGIYMLVISLLAMAAAAANSFVVCRISASFAKNLRSDVFKKTESFSLGEFNKFSTASLITRTTNDITQLQNILTMVLRFMLTAPITCIGGIILALKTCPSLSWTILLGIICICGLVALLFSITTPRFTKIQKLVDRLNLVSRESLSGVMVIRAFKNQNHQQERFDSANAALTQNNIFVNRLMSFMHPAMSLIMNLTSMLILYVASGYISAHRLEVGDYVAYIEYAAQIMQSFLMMSNMFIQLPRSVVSAKRVAEVLDTKPEITEEGASGDFADIKGSVEFSHVDFKYPSSQANALSDISFKITRGETLAVIGSTGSGKSTLVNLIPRFYNPTNGKIFVDGADITKVSPHRLREKIGFVPQNSILFSGTVGSNIGYGLDDFTDSDLKDAAAVAQASDFIAQTKNGFDAPISQSGKNISGGQKQRVAIARALAKKSEILIFDDSFSALDFKTDAALRSALKEKTADTTVIIVAQRIATVMNADKILVLDKGRIVGEGKHRELLVTCPVYNQIALTQLTKEELENE